MNPPSANAEGMFKEAAALFIAGEEPAAIGIFIKILRGDWCRDVKSAALNNLGQILEKVGHSDRALECYAMAIDLTPQDFVILSNYGHLLKDFGRFDESAQFQRRALFLSGGNDALPRLRQAMLELLLGDFENGWDDYEARLDPPLHSEFVEITH